MSAGIGGAGWMDVAQRFGSNGSGKVKAKHAAEEQGKRRRTSRPGMRERDGRGSLTFVHC